MDDFRNRLQEQIFMEVKEELGEEIFRRWENQLFRGKLDNPDGHACLKGKCGDTMEIFIKFGEERVREASYMTDGCASSNLCGSFAAELSLGKTPDELFEVTGEAIIEKLGSITAVEEHCAYLAAETLQEALNDFMIKQAMQEKKCRANIGPEGSSDAGSKDKSPHSNCEPGEFR